MFNKILRKKYIGVALITFMGQGFAVANDRAMEAENLTRIITEIELVRATAERMHAETHGNSGAVRFKYDALDKALADIAKQIGLHLQVMEQTPRFKRFEKDVESN